MTHKTMYRVAFALLLLPVGAGAQQTVERTAAASANGVVEIENIAGSVRVEAWDRNEVSMRAELGRGVERVDFESESGETHIRVVYPRKGRPEQKIDAAGPPSMALGRCMAAVEPEPEYQMLFVG